MQNLSDVVQWAMANDSESQAIAFRAREAVREMMSVEGQTLYAAMVFELFAQLSHYSVSSRGVGKQLRCEPSGECYFGGSFATYAEA